MQASNNLQKFTIYYRKEKEGGFSGRCIELPAAISQGETLEELKKNMTEGRGRDKQHHYLRGSRLIVEFKKSWV
jgi:hypothetical protein